MGVAVGSKAIVGVDVASAWSGMEAGLAACGTCVDGPGAASGERGVVAEEPGAVNEGRKAGAGASGAAGVGR